MLVAEVTYQHFQLYCHHFKVMNARYVVRIEDLMGQRGGELVIPTDHPAYDEWTRYAVTHDMKVTILR